MSDSYLHGVSATPLRGETIGENLRQTVGQHGHREALVCPWQSVRLTYRELWEQTCDIARGLLALGIQRGDRVGLWSPNRYEWVVVQLAAARVGAILTNINPAFKTAELEHALNLSGVRLLLHARRFRHSDYCAILAATRDRCPALELALTLDDDWDALRTRGAQVSTAALATREAQLQFDDPVNIQYTSGTTGSPKGATLSHHNILNNGFFVGEGLGLQAGERVCIPVPFYHCFGMVMGNLACTSHGATMVIPGESFDALTVLQTVEAERCSILYGVPTMFIAELDHPRFADFDLSTLRSGIMAGSPCPIEVMKRVIERMHMREVTICYGMTETSPVSTQTAGSDPLAKRVGSVGRVHPHVEIKVIDGESGAIVPRGRPGELCTRGYSVMLGYFGNPAATQSAIDGAGWMHTGDLATVDGEGYVNIVGRIKDMIIRGGENIYPREIEEFLHSHPGVSEAQVFGIPSERYGEEVAAWIRPRSDVNLSLEELAAFCAGRIATYKIPRHFKLVSEFPLTVSGKVQKYRLRELAIVELGLELIAATRTA